MSSAQLTWQYRAVELTRAHHSQLGCIVVAMLGYGRYKLPRYGTSCTISPDGIVRADAWDSQGHFMPGAVIAPLDEILYQFNKLGDALKLNDAERIEMFETLAKWVSHDGRVKPEYSLQ